MFFLFVFTYCTHSTTFLFLTAVGSTKRNGLRTSSSGKSTMGIKEALSWMNSNIVSVALRDRRANVLLDGYPPLISVSEKTLRRPTRVTLVQLRSDFSKFLNSYLTRVNLNISDPPMLLFAPYNQTSLTPLSL